MGRKRSNRTQGGFVEDLETRRLLAQISIQSYGAVANDGRDDRSAIIAAMNASGSGDTILFPAGTYNLSDKIMLKGGGRTYLGQDTVLRGDPSKHIFHIQEDTMRVQGFVFEGKPIMIDKPRNEMVANLVINDNVFRINASADNTSGITFTTGLRNTQITNNSFQLGSRMGIYGYYWDGLTIANNEFLNGAQGMHIDDITGNSRNLLCEQNLFSGIRRMGIEYQGGGSNSIFQDNWFDKPTLTSNFNDNNEAFAYSIIADRSRGTIARRNVIIAPERPDGVGVRIGFEIGGDNALIEDNYISGVNHVVAANDGVGTTSVLVRNNFWENILQGPVGRGLTAYNNGPNVDLTWDISRGKPGPNRRYGEASPQPQPQIPTANPTTPAPVPQDGAIFCSDLSWTSATNGWGAIERNRSNGEMSGTDGKTITLNGVTYSRGLGVHAGSEIVYNLNGQYGQFFSDIGIDDEVGSNGNVVFQVWVDGVKAFDSGNMTGSTATRAVSVDVAGKNSLRLVVTTGSGGNAYDHADWANARLTLDDATPTPDPDPIPTGDETWVGDLAWTSATNGWGAAERNRSNGEMGGSDGRVLSIRGTTYAMGLGVHSNSDIRYSLDGQYGSFASDIGIDDETNGNGSVVFQVYVDGTLKYDSGIVRGRDAVKQLNVDVSGAQELRLVVTNAGDGFNFDHADWAGARLLA